MNDLKGKTVSGFIFKFLERAGAQGIKFLVSLLLARILLPEQYGTVALVISFIAFCDVFVTYGFGNSLIADKNSDDIDFSTCFYFGIALSLVVYALVFFGAPIIARFFEKFDESVLVPVIRVMGLRIPIAAINSVQHAYVSKHMMFKKFFYATLIGTIISGAIAVVMAYMNFGVWALVEQYLGNVFIDTVCLAVIVKWRPIKAFSFQRLKKIYNYGWKILLVGLLDTGYKELRSFIIGKKYSKSDLGYYNKGNDFPATGMSLVEPTVNGVLFPALSQCRDNQDEMRNITRRVIKSSTYIIFPIMIGLASVATPLITVLLTEKWLPSVIFLQIGCLAYMFRPLQFINNSVIKASGRSGLLLKLDFLKKGIGIVLLLISMNFGVEGIAISLAVTYCISAIINIAPNRKILNYGYMAQIKDVLANLSISLVMGGIVYAISFIKLNSILLLCIQIVVGVVVYILLSIITKNDSFFYFRNMVMRLLGNKLSKKQNHD